MLSGLVYNFCEYAYLLANISMFLYGCHYWFVTAEYLLAREAAKHDAWENGAKQGKATRVETLSDRTTQTPFVMASDFEWPMVTIQLPIFNEGSVITRLIEGCLALDYPDGKLEIQVLDDSTDGTPDIVRATITKNAPLRFDVHHIHRTDRTGYKAGAMHEAMQVAKGEFVGIFDADFVPEASYLRDMIPHFYSDMKNTRFHKSGNGQKGLCCVQSRWGFLNRDYSLFTKTLAMAIDGHFMVEQPARYGGGFMLNFNGTGGIWRSAAIHEAGGWQHDTLAEDLDLSFRAQFKGYQIKYVPSVVVPGECPPSLTAFKKQQARWAKGTIQCLVKHVGQVWRQPTLSLRQKIEASCQLAGYLVNLFMCVSMVLIFPCAVWWPSDTVQNFLGSIPLPLVIGVSIGPSVMVFLSQFHQTGFKWSRTPMLFLLIVLGYGITVSNTYACFEGFFKKGGEFVRTQKFGGDNGETGQNLVETQTNTEGSVVTKKKKSAGDAYKFFPKSELAYLTMILCGWSTKLVSHRGFEGCDIWVGIFAISYAIMIFFGMQEMNIYRKATQMATRANTVDFTV